MAFVRKTQSGMLKYDPFLKDFVLNTDGTGVNVHPVDAKIALLLGIPQGSFLPEIQTGNPLKNLRITSTINETVIDGIKTCLKEPIDAGDIELIDVVVEPSTNPTSRLYIGVFYRNLRLETPEIQKVTALWQTSRQI